MDKAAVARVFAKFEREFYTNYDHRSAAELPGIHVFNTNSPLGAHVVYGDTGGYLSIWEACTVWFDTNETIVAYLYELRN